MNKPEADVSVVFELFTLLSKIVFEGLDIKEVSLSNMELLALMVLSANPGMPMSKIAEELGTSKAQVSRMITSMEDEKIVERQHNPVNRRVVNVFLTDHGNEIIELKKQQVMAHMSQKLIHFSDEDSLSFSHHLEMMASLINKYDIFKG